MTKELRYILCFTIILAIVLSIVLKDKIKACEKVGVFMLIAKCVTPTEQVKKFKLFRVE